MSTPATHPGAVSIPVSRFPKSVSWDAKSRARTLSPRYSIFAKHNLQPVQRKLQANFGFGETQIPGL